MKKHSNMILIIGLICMAIAFVGMNNANKPISYKMTCYKLYIVNNGDTLSQIADKYKPDFQSINNYMTDIQCANCLREVIYPGQKLLLPVEKVE